MNKYFSYHHLTILTLTIITAMFIAFPQKGWCTDSSEKPMEERNKRGDFHKLTDSASGADSEEPHSQSSKQTKIDNPSPARKEDLFLPLGSVAMMKASLKEGEEAPSRNVGEVKNYKKHMRLTIEKTNEVGIAEEENPKAQVIPVSWGITEEEVEAAFSQSPNPVCILGAGGYFKRLNSHWSTALGWSEEELLGKPYYEFIHPDDLGKTREYDQFLTPTGFVNRFVAKNGIHRWFNWMRFSAGAKAKDTQSFCILMDVTVDYLLREENEKKIRILNDHLQIQSSIIKAVTELQKLYLGELGRHGDESNIDLSFQHIIQHFVKLSQSEFGFISSILNDEGKRSIRVKRWDANPKLDERSQKLFEECKQEEGGFSYLNQLLNKVISTEKLLIINDGEQSSSEITGSSEHALLFKSFLGVPLLVKDELVGIVALVNRPYGYNQQLIEWFDPLFVLGARIVSEANVGYFRKKAKSERQTREKAEAKNEAKSGFLAHMSHEIRTPLTGLLGMLELIDKNAMQMEDLNYLQMAHGSGLALLSILNDILDISKIEAGQLKLEAIPFNPVSMAQEVTHLLLLDAQKKALDLKLITSPQIPPCLVGDPTRLRQILFNLAGNAIKFTNQGSVTVSLDGRDDNDHFMLTGNVADTGIGISLETQERLFKSFSQADTSILRRFGGTGLGLFITKQLCERMGGNIKVVSEVGKGSTFNFNIILDRVKDLMPQISSFVNLPDKLPNIRVLIAEDNTVNQLVLKTMLTRAGCSATAVWNGQEAVRAIAHNHYDLILMDGEMPVMDGFEATRKIRESFTEQALPIIGVTAHAMVEDRDRFLAVGMNGYLTKPIHKEDLYAEILKCLSLTKK